MRGGGILSRVLVKIPFFIAIIGHWLYMLEDHWKTVQTNINHHSCPKTVFLIQAGGRDVLGVAYFGPEVPPEAGKVQNPAVSGAMDGEANETKRICRLPANGISHNNLK
jgi:hypothetical protein